MTATAYALTITPADGTPTTHAPEPLAELFDQITAHMTEHLGTLPPANLPGSLAYRLANTAPGTDVYDPATGATLRLDPASH
jgi:hypothetical protein